MSHSPLASDQKSRRYDDGWARISELTHNGSSFSGRERNCCYLNTGDGRFADASAASGLDFIDDGRSTVVVDWDHDGDLDLWFSNRTGPRLRFLQNDLGNRQGYLAVRLHGKQCNRDAIGARLELMVEGRKHIKTLRAGDGYLAQSSKWVHFGLGTATAIEELVVRWPGGMVQRFKDLRTNRRYVIEQDGQPLEWKSPRQPGKLVGNRLPTQHFAGVARLPLVDPVPLPEMPYLSFDGDQTSLLGSTGGPVLVNLWATWCQPCLQELRELHTAREKLDAAGLEVVALSVDGVSEDTSATSEERTKARDYLTKLGVAFRSGSASAEQVKTLELMQDVLVGFRGQRGQIPISFLVDSAGRLAVIYRGRVDVRQVLEDVRVLSDNTSSPANSFPGTWYERPYGSATVLAELAGQFARHDMPDSASQYATLAADLAGRDRTSTETQQQLAQLLLDLARRHRSNGRLDASIDLFETALQMKPDDAEAFTTLGNIHYGLEQFESALAAYEQALRINPTLLQAQFNTGLIHLAQERWDMAIKHFERALALDSRQAVAHRCLGLAHARRGRLEQAAQHFQIAIQLDPRDVEAQRNLNAVLRGSIP